MLDPALLRENMAAVQAALQNRGADLAAALNQLMALESDRRKLLPELEGLKQQQNKAGEEAGRAKREGRDIGTIQEASRERGQTIKQMEAQLQAIEEHRNQAALVIPNIPHASVPVGKSAADNQEV